MSFSLKSKVETLINTLINKIYILNSQQVLKLDNMEILIIDSLFNTKIMEYNEGLVNENKLLPDGQESD